MKSTTDPLEQHLLELRDDRLDAARTLLGKSDTWDLTDRGFRERMAFDQALSDAEVAQRRLDVLAAATAHTPPLELAR